jgi:hypothetical protein
MRRIVPILLLLACAMLSARPSPRITGQYDRPAPVTDYWSRADSLHGFDVTHYDLDVSVFTANHTIIGSVVAHVTALQNLNSISYELEGGLSVQSVQVNDAPATYSFTDGAISINLGAIPAGQSFTTRVEYSGTPSLSDDVYHIGMIFSTNYAFTLSDPSGMRWWAPVYDHPWDKATWTLAYTLRSDWECAANGLQTSETFDGEGFHTVTWEVTDPTVPHLICFTASNYDELDFQHGDLLIQNFVPASMMNDAVVDLALVPGMIQAFEDHFGPYPFEKYGNAVVPMVTYGAMEHQTMTTLNTSYITGDGSGAPTIAHELAHSWFGNCVTPLTWKDVWLSESFATYSEAVYTEAIFGVASMRQYIESNFHSYYLNWENAADPPRIYDPAYDEYFNPQSYEKGASVLHELRLLVGAQNFFDILRAYMTQYHNGWAITSEFQAIAEQVSGLDLDQFFQQWIYEPGCPTYDYALFYDSEALRVLPVVQTGCSTGTQFVCKVPFTIHTATDIDSVLATANPNGGDGQSFLLSDGEVQSAEFDPHHWLLHRAVTQHEPTMQFASASDGAANVYWSAFWAPAAVTGYRVFRASSASGPFTVLVELPGDQLHYIDSGLTNGVTYYYAVQALRGSYATFMSDPIPATPIDFPMDQGILFVDETANGSGTAISPTDAQSDAFYDAAIAPEYTSWDYDSDGPPSLDLMRHYSIIVWASDDFSAIHIDNHLNDLGAFLLAGGCVLVSGWKTAMNLTDDFLDNFLDAGSVDMANSAIFTGASGAFPDLAVDPAKTLTAWNGMLPYVCTFPEAGNGIYNFNGSGYPCAVTAHPNGQAIFLGFPLYFMQADGVAAFFAQALAEFQQTSTGDHPLPPAGISMRCWPNPAHSVANVAWSQDRPGKAIVEIYNLRGQRTTRLSDAEASAGEHTLIWNGCDDNGRPVASGMYLAITKCNGRTVARKLALLR